MLMSHPFTDPSSLPSLSTDILCQSLSVTLERRFMNTLRPEVPGQWLKVWGGPPVSEAGNTTEETPAGHVCRLLVLVLLQNPEQVGFHPTFPLNTGHTNNSLCQTGLGMTSKARL